MFATEPPSTDYTINLNGPTYIKLNHTCLLYGLSAGSIEQLQKRQLNYLDAIIIPNHRISYAHSRALCCFMTVLDDYLNGIRCSKIYASKEVIQVAKEYYREPAYHLKQEDRLKDKAAYYQGLDPNPIPNFPEEVKFLLNSKAKKRGGQLPIEFIELPPQGKSIQIAGVALINRQNTLTLTSPHQTLLLEDNMLTTQKLQTTNRQPMKFRKVDRKLPFMHLSFKAGKFSSESRVSEAMYVIAPNCDASVGLILLLHNSIILIDPPEGIISALTQLQLSIEHISCVIVTSAKETNSAGLLELFLKMREVHIITHIQIYQRLLELYTSIYLFNKDLLLSKLILRPITIGSSLPYKKLLLKFYFGFSTDLSLIFTFKHKQTSLMFYGNSVFDFDLIKQARTLDVISEERYKQLIDLSWPTYCAMFFNVFERGFTPFQQLPELIKEKICLNSYLKSSNYPRKHLNLFEPDFNSIQVKYEAPFNTYENVIGLPFMYLLSSQKGRQFIEMFETGAAADKLDSKKFYIMAQGSLKIGGKWKRKGQYFNQSTFFDENLQCANVQIVEKATVMWISKPDFLQVFNSSQRQVIKKCLLKTNGTVTKQNLFEKNRINSQLPLNTISDLEAATVQKMYSSGQIVWNSGDESLFFIYVSKGNLTISSSNSPERQLTAGCFVGEYYNLMTNRKLQSKVEVIKDSHLLIITKQAFSKWLQLHPNQLFYFLAKPLIFM